MHSFLIGIFTVMLSDSDLWIRLNVSSTQTVALYFYMMAYGLPVNEDEWGADICSHPPFYCCVPDVSTLAFILLAICGRISQRYIKRNQTFKLDA